MFFFNFFNLFNFKKNNIKDMSYMFNECTSLTFLIYLILIKIIIKDMSYMFNECTSLIYLNLFNFNNNNSKDMSICLINLLI